MSRQIRPLFLMATLAAASVAYPSAAGAATFDFSNGFSRDVKSVTLPSLRVDQQHAYDMRAMGDGSTIVVGVGGDFFPAHGKGERFAFARISRSGRPWRLAGGSWSQSFGGTKIVLRSSSIAADGKVYFSFTGPSRGKRSLFVCRLTPRGGLDAEFGRNGCVRAGKSTIATKQVAATPAGGVLLFGNGTVQMRDESGSVVTSFGANGTASVPDFVARDAVLTIDGAVYLTGWKTPKATVVKLTAAGLLDPSFAAGGLLDLSRGLSQSAALDVDIDIDGSPVVLVRSTVNDGSGCNATSNIARISSAGVATFSPDLDSFVICGDQGFAEVTSSRVMPTATGPVAIRSESWWKYKALRQFSVGRWAATGAVNKSEPGVSVAVDAAVVSTDAKRVVAATGSNSKHSRIKLVVAPAP